MMRCLVFLSLLFLALVSAQETVPCPNSGSLVNPCEVTATNDPCANVTRAGVACTLCQDGTVGGCQSDSCQPLQLSTGACVCGYPFLPPCPATPAPNASTTCYSDAGCPTACPYGRVRDANGCITCTCNPAPPCANTVCPDLVCSLDTNVIVPPSDTSCCPSCVPKPIGCGACVEPICPPSTDAVRQFTVIDTCGCKRCANVSCATLATPCNLPNCPAGSELFYPPGSCCPICTPPPRCSAVSNCPPAPTCIVGTKLVVPDGECCPRCVPYPSNICNTAACVTPTCVAGQSVVTVDTDCCPVCRGNIDCDAVLCPIPVSATPNTGEACLPIFVSDRAGACCTSCSPCRRTIDAPSANIACTRDDVPVCDGSSTGTPATGCTPKPPIQLKKDCRNFTIDVSASAFANASGAVDGGDASARLIKYLVAQCAACTAAEKEAVLSHLQNLRVSFVSKVGTQVTISVCFVADAADTTTDPTALGDSISNSLVSQGATTPGSSSDAHTLAASAALFLAMFALLL